MAQNASSKSNPDVDEQQYTNNARTGRRRAQGMTVVAIEASKMVKLEIDRETNEKSSWAYPTCATGSRGPVGEASGVATATTDQSQRIENRGSWESARGSAEPNRHIRSNSRRKPVSGCMTAWHARFHLDGLFGPQVAVGHHVLIL